VAKFPVGASADIGDTVPSDYWQKLGELLNSGGGSFYNVKNPDFGALGNNSNDDTAEIQACIDASAAGDTILFPPGTYLVSAPLVLKPFRRYLGWGAQWGDPSAVVIKAANGSSANFQSTSTHSGLLVSEAWNTNATVAGGPVDIRWLSLDGNKANNATGQHSGLVLYGEYWSTLVGVRAYNNKKHGLLMTRTAKNNVAQLSGVSDIGVHDLHCSSNDLDGVCQLSTGAGNNTDVMFTGRTVLYDNGGSGMTAENPGGWWLNNLHLWNNSVHGVYMDTGSHGVKINGLYVESFGIAAAAATQYFGLRLRTFNAAPTTNTVPVQLSNVTVQTTDPAGTSSFYCISVVGDGTDAHAYLANVHALGANTARGHGIELYAASGTFTLHESGVATTGFNAGQGKEYAGTAAYAYDPPRVLTATTTWDPPSMNTATNQTTTLTVAGAAPGDPAAASLSSLTGAGNWHLTARVTGTGASNVSVTLRNDSGSTVDVASGTLRVTVWKH
jgi:hypothetical protein